MRQSSAVSLNVAVVILKAEPTKLMVASPAGHVVAALVFLDLPLAVWALLATGPNPEVVLSVPELGLEEPVSVLLAVERVMRGQLALKNLVLGLESPHY